MIYLYAATAGVSVKLAIEIYNGGGIEIAPEVRAAVPRMSYRTMKRWSRAFKLKGLTGLMPAPGNRAGSGIMDLDSELRDFTIAMLAHNHLLSSKMIFDAMVKHFTDKRLPSCGRFRGWLKRWKLSHREHFERLSNPDSHRSKYLVSLGHQHSDLVRPFQVVQFDGTPANVLCSDGRYFLTLGIRHFYAPTFCGRVEDGDSGGRAALLSQGDSGGSVPEVGVHRSRAGISLRFACKPLLRVAATSTNRSRRIAQILKGHIERANGTLVSCCLMALPGYMGRNPAEFSAIESQTTFAARLGKAEAWRFE